MTKKVDFHCTVVVDGRTWPITIEGHVETDKIAENIAQAARWLVRNGILPAGSGPPGKASDATPRIDAPICPVHGEPMKVSKFTKKGYVVTYYCPQPVGDKFCKHTASMRKEGSWNFSEGR